MGLFDGSAETIQGAPIILFLSPLFYEPGARDKERFTIPGHATEIGNYSPGLGLSQSEAAVLLKIAS